MEVSRYVRLIKVVLILTMILLSPIKGLADGRKDEKIDRIENLDMSKKKEVSKAQSRDAVKRDNSNNSNNSKKTVRNSFPESRNNSQSWKLLGYIGFVVLSLLLVICSCLLFVVNRLSKGLSALKEELSARINPQPEKGGVSMNKNKERSREEKGSPSAKEQRDWEDLRRNNEHLKSENSRLEQENSSLKKEIENLRLLAKGCKKRRVPLVKLIKIK